LFESREVSLFSLFRAQRRKLPSDLVGGFKPLGELRIPLALLPREGKSIAFGHVCRAAHEGSVFDFLEHPPNLLGFGKPALCDERLLQLGIGRPVLVEEGSLRLGIKLGHVLAHALE